MNPLRVLVSRALSQACFFFPVVGELSQHYLRAQELAAAQAVLARQGQGAWLASALYKLLTAPTGARRPAAVAGLLNLAALRIDQLLATHQPVPLRLSGRSLLVSGFLILLIGTVVLSPALVGTSSHVHALVEHGLAICRQRPG